MPRDKDQNQGVYPQGGYPQDAPPLGYPQGAILGYPQGTPPQGYPQGAPPQGYPHGAPLVYPHGAPLAYPQIAPPQGYPHGAPLGYLQGAPLLGYPHGAPLGYPQGAPPQGYPHGAPLGYPLGAPPQGYPHGAAPHGYPQGASPQAYPKGEGDYSVHQGDAESLPDDLGEDGTVEFLDFTEKSIRRSFIRKVYSILMCQLLVTMGFIALFLFHRPTKLFVYARPWLIWVSLAVTLVTAIAMSCFGSMRRRAPTNFIFLGVFTVAESFLLGVISSKYNVDVVLMAVGITAALCLALTLFAFQTKWDFTVFGGVLLCALFVLVIFGFIKIFLPASKTMTLVYASVGALLFSFYLVYDTQLMMGGKHKYSISPEEYIFAALNLYLDVINLFLFILRIIGVAKS